MNHCLLVGESAEKIARACGMNGEKAYVLGLLHDIGRRYGRLHFGHIVYGYKFMGELNYDEVARVCLTHSFPIQDMHDYIGNMDVPPEKREQAKGALMTIEYDDYDRLIQLCYAFCMTEGVTDMDTRMDDVMRLWFSFWRAREPFFFFLKEKWFSHKQMQEAFLCVLMGDRPMRAAR